MYYLSSPGGTIHTTRIRSSIHLSHSTPHHGGLLDSLLQLLLPQLLLDIQAERNRTFCLWTQFCMPAAESNQLFADRTAAVVLTLATLGVVYDPFHLVT